MINVVCMLIILTCNLAILATQLRRQNGRKDGRMSIVIKGMRMPESCASCPFAERIPPGRTRCLLTRRLLAENYEAPSRLNRNEYCPIEERQTGEWIVSESEEVGALGSRYITYTCPSCGWNHTLIIPGNICPICGSDNRGERDEHID